jgi:hypothetical protein
VEVRINTVQVMSATDDFASLEEATSTKYVYRFSLNVSKTATNNAAATRLVIRAYAEDPKNAVQLSLFNQNTQQTLNISNQNAAQLVSSIQRRAFDITTNITATRNNALATQTYTLKDLIVRFNHGVGYTVITNSTKPAVRNEIYAASNAINQQPLNEDRNIAQLSKELLQQYKIDPANAVKRAYAENTAYETNNGLIVNFYDSQNNAEKMIASSLMTTNNTQTTTTARVQTYSVADRDVITIHPEFTFPAETIQTQDFYAMFSLYDLRNNLVQEFVKLVRHQTNVTRIKRVVIPPDFTVSKLGGGQLMLTLKQKDLNATGVKIYKTVYNSSVKTRSKIQDIVGNYDLLAGETKTIVIQNTDLGLLLFRALSYNANSDISSDFTSQIVEGNENVDTNANVYVSINHEYNRRAVRIVINDIPDDIAFLQLYRTNLSIDPYAETLLTTFFIGGQGSNSSYAYIENVLDQNKSYRYRCALTDIKGQRYEASGMIEFVYIPQAQDYAAITVSSPTITPIQLPGSSTQYFDVSFNVSYAITNRLEDNLRQLLTNQNLISFYGNDISPERLRDLLVTKVELRDLETNDKLLMGYTDGNYVQSLTRYGLLSRSSRYTYELTTYVRKPATLLEATVLNKASTPRSNSNQSPPTYSYKPYNVNNPYGLLTGTNPQKNGNEFIEQYGLDQFEFSEITGISYVNVDLKPPIARINGLRANVFNSKNVDLTWSVNGDQSNISHFIIRRRNIATGKLDLIGKAHGINTQNKYVFTDNVRYTDSGVYVYIVAMQFFNFNLSPNYTSNEVIL